MVVKWSACSPYTLTNRVQITLKPLCKSCLKRTKINNKKGAGVGPFIKQMIKFSVGKGTIYSHDLISVGISVTRFGKISPHWSNFKIL